jgi:hypothetical protein
MPAEASGTLTWVGSDSGVPVLPFVGLALLVVAAVAGALLIRRRRGEEVSDTGTAESPEKEVW